MAIQQGMHYNKRKWMHRNKWLWSASTTVVVVEGFYTQGVMTNYGTQEERIWQGGAGGAALVEAHGDGLEAEITEAPEEVIAEAG